LSLGFLLDLKKLNITLSFCVLSIGAIQTFQLKETIQKT
jgi:hypothetical protein